MATETIVLIDDSEGDRYLVRRMLEREWPDAKIVEYKSAYLAVDDFASDHRFTAAFGPDVPVLVLLDINMPRMTGFEFLDRVGPRIRKQLAVVVVFTSSTRTAEREQAEAYELVRGFTSKPMSAADVRHLRTLLDQAG